jgi:hypothetical protein
MDEKRGVGSVHVCIPAGTDPVTSTLGYPPCARARARVCVCVCVCVGRGRGGAADSGEGVKRNAYQASQYSLRH